MNNYKPTNEHNYRLYPERDKKIGKATKALAAVAIFGSLLYLGNGMQGGSKSAESLGDIDKSIESVTITPESRLRFDPYVMNREGSNQLPPIDHEITIAKTENIRVHDDETNGNWYGIPVADIEKVNPEFKDRGDKDGVVWVNHQGAEVRHDNIASNTKTDIK